jgi:hypothetical protein
MDDKDELMFFAGMALMGLVARGDAPSESAQKAWQYAQFMINFKPKGEQE